MSRENGDQFFGRTRPERLGGNLRVKLAPHLVAEVEAPPAAPGDASESPTLVSQVRSLGASGCSHRAP